MIRSSKISLKYSNTQKRQSLLEIVKEYNHVIQSIIDLIWNLDIFKRIEDLCEYAGVRLSHIDPSYTSQRCNKCGWVQKANRVGSMFKCLKCGNTLDADKNASLNISLNLPRLDFREIRRTSSSLGGFYWSGQEFIVPVT